jgi:hypothetical protein
MQFTGAPFKGSTADAHLRPLGCNSGILERHDWTDELGKPWEDNKKLDVIARATMSWAVQTVLETGQKSPDGNAQVLATTDSSRGIGACVCHWAVGMEALCASIASLDRTRKLKLSANGIGPNALTCLALHGIGNGIEVVDLSDNPLVVLDWQGNELPEEMQPVEGLLRRSFGVELRAGLFGLKPSAPQVAAPQVTVGGANLGCMELSLSGTHFGPLGLCELYKLHATSLETLELGRNASLGRYGKKLLAQALRGMNGSTKHKSLARLKKLVVDLGSVSSVVLSQTTTELDLREKQLESADLCIIGACLSTGLILESLTTLDLSRNAAISDSGKIALAAGLAAGDAPTIQSACFGFGRVGEQVLYLDAQLDKIDMRGRGLTFGDVTLLAACISPKQRDGEKAMGVGIVEVDLSDNGLGDNGVSPILAAIVPAEAARQQRFVMKLRERAADAKQAMVVKAGRLGTVPEVTPEEEAVANRAKMDMQLEPLLLALANGAVQPQDVDQVWGFNTSSVPPPQIKTLRLAGNNLGNDDKEGGVVQSDSDGPQVETGAIAIMLYTVLVGDTGLERLCLARNPTFSGRNDRNIRGLSLGLPESTITWLDLTDCGVGPLGGVALADAVSERPFELVIHKNGLGREGKAALGQAIPDSKYGKRAAKQAEEDEIREQKEEERREAKALKRAAREKSKAEAQAARAEALMLKAEAKAQAQRAALQQAQAARAAAEAARLKQNEEQAAQAQLDLEERVEHVRKAMGALELVLAQQEEYEGNRNSDDGDRNLVSEPPDCTSAWQELERSLTGSNSTEAAAHVAIREAQAKLVKYKHEQAEKNHAERAALELSRRQQEKAERENRRRMEKAAADARKRQQVAATAAKQQEAEKIAAANRARKVEEKRWSGTVKAQRQAAAAAHRSELCVIS